MFEANAEAEAKASSPRLRPRPKFRPKGHFGLEDLTSLLGNSWGMTVRPKRRVFSCWQ